MRRLALGRTWVIPGLVLFTLTSAGSAPTTAEQVRDSKPASLPIGQASIAGTVISADSARPMRRAILTLSGGEPRSVRTAETDEQGSFSFVNLPAGEYVLAASKGGYVESIYGQKQPGSGRPGTPIRLLGGQQLDRLSVPLVRGGVLTGTVFDDAGEPVLGIVVRAYRWVMKSGERTLQQATSATTDDRGVYRLHSLLPGDYVVGAAATGGYAFVVQGASYTSLVNKLDALGDVVIFRSPAPEASPVKTPSTGFATVYYPGTTLGSAAESIPVAAGEERGAIDIRLQAVPLTRVAGQVVGATGPTSGAPVQLVDTAQVAGTGVRNTRADGAGRFAFDGIPPGQYVLMSKTTAKGAPQLEASGREAAEFLAAADRAKAASIAAAISAVAPMWATAEVIVDGQGQTDVMLVLQAGVTVSGSVSFEGAGEAPRAARLTVGLTPVGVPRWTGEFAQAGPAPLDANGRFSIRGVMPGRYRLSVLGGAPAGHTLQSAVFGGQDILDVPLEVDGSHDVAGGLVTFSARTTEVSGVIHGASGQPAPGFTVIAFAADERFWTPESRRIQASRPASDGRYVFRNLPPGDYRLIAVSDVEPGRWFDPVYLRQLAGFASFTLGPGARHVQDFRVR